MSLQGSLDTFALPDVLVLLASTHKSGELHVAGSRSIALARHPDTEGRLWFDTGGIVGHDVGQTVEPADALFELLRLNQGTFSFLAGTPSGGGPRVEIEGVLKEAEARLVDWREIEAVVPSLEAWLQLSADPPLAHVSMRAEQWRLVVAIAAGCPVGTAIGQLGLEELPGCRAVKELVEAGLVVLATQPSPAAGPSLWNEPEPTAPEAAPVDAAQPDLDIVYHRPEEPEEDTTYRYEPAEEPRWVGEDLTPAWASPTSDAEQPLAPAFDASPAHQPTSAFEQAPAFEAAPPFEPAAPYDAAGRVPPATTAAAPSDWRAELGDLPDLDAIASLPPKRRRAEGEEAVPTAGMAAVDEAEDGEEPLNRGLLLKFLSSVRN